METSNFDKKERARKRVDELKGFYWHLGMYLLVNSVLTTLKISRNIADGESFIQAFWDFGTFAVWFFWGIGIVFHAVKVFSYNPFFNKEWEERQIRKYMDQERRESEKYK